MANTLKVLIARFTAFEAFDEDLFADETVIDRNGIFLL
jgi:hypothetical protein